MLETNLELDLSAAREQVAELGDELDSIFDEARELNLELDTAGLSAALSDVESILDNIEADAVVIDGDASGVTAAADEASSALNDVGASGDTAGDSLVSAFGDSEQIIDSLSSSVGRLNGNLGKAVAALGEVGGLGVAAAAAAVGALALLGNQVQNAQQEIIIGTGASGDRLAELTAIAIELKATIPGISFQQAGEDIAQLDTLLEATNSELVTLGSGLGLTGTDATTFARLLNSLNLEASDGVILLEQLFVASQNYGISVNDQVTSLQKYGQILGTANLSQEEQVLLFSQLFAAGADVERVQSGLARVLGQVTTEGGDAAAVLQRIFDTTNKISFAELTELGFDTRSISSIQQAVDSGIIDLQASLDITGESLTETLDRARPAVDEMKLAVQELIAAAAPVGLGVTEGLILFAEGVELALTGARDFGAGLAIISIEVAEFAGAVGDFLSPLADLNPFDGSFLGIGGGGDTAVSEEARRAGQRIGTLVGSELNDGIRRGFFENPLAVEDAIQIEADSGAIVRSFDRETADIVSAIEQQRDEATEAIANLGASLAGALIGAAPAIDDALDALLPEDDVVDVDGFFDSLETQIAARTNFAENIAVLIGSGSIDENSLDFLLSFGDTAAQALAQSFRDSIDTGDFDPVNEFSELFQGTLDADAFLVNLGTLAAEASTTFVDGFRIDLSEIPIPIDSRPVVELDRNIAQPRNLDLLTVVDTVQLDSVFLELGQTHSTNVEVDVDADEFIQLKSVTDAGLEMQIDVTTFLDANARALLNFAANDGNARALPPGFDAGGSFFDPAVITIAERGNPEAVIGGHHDPRVTARRLDEVGALEGVRMVEAERIAAQAVSMLAGSPAAALIQQASGIDTAAMETQLRRQSRMLETIAGASMDQVDELRSTRPRRPLSTVGGW